MGTPGDRGSHMSHNMVSQTTDSNSQVRTSNRAYSDVVNSINVSQTSTSTVANNAVFPPREQAIILNVVENLKLVDYVSNIGKIVGPKHIIFASRISNNRICIFLSSTTLVDLVIQQHNRIKYKWTRNQYT